MLANLLPGIRDIRTPLATGYLWLLTFWLWIPSHFKDIPPSSGIPGDVTRLAHYAGRAGAAVAISFVAYLVGVLSKSLDPPFTRLGTFGAYIPQLFGVRMNRLLFWSKDLLRNSKLLRRLYRSSDHSLEWWSVRREFGPRPPIVRLTQWDFWRRSYRYRRLSEGEEVKRDRMELDFIERAVLVKGQLSFMGMYSLYAVSQKMVDRGQIKKTAQVKYFRYLLQEVPKIGNALVGEEAELYSVYDRLISEYEFRTSIAVPLIVLVITLADNWSLFWLLTLLPLMVLLSTGSRQRMAAGDLLADAVRLGRIDVAMPPELASTSVDPAAGQNDRGTLLLGRL